MSRRSLSLVAHCLLILLMVATTSYAPIQSVAEAIQASSIAQDASDATPMPCDTAGHATAERGMSCDCCTPSSCDLAACMGTACLLELPRLVAAVRYAEVDPPQDTAAPPTRPLDTPLRPPVA